MTIKRHPQGMLGPCDTPWNERYELDEPVFRRHVEGMLDAGFREVYVMGTAGEGYAMTDSQFQNVVDVFVDVTDRPGVTPQVGVISLSTGHIIERLGYVYDKGVRMLQISLPSWGPLSDSEMITFFKTVCGSFPDAKFLHYNIVRTKRVLNGDDYRRVVDEIPNLVATKNSTYDMGFIRDIMLKAPELQHFFLQHSFPYGCLHGECSLLSSFAGIFPDFTRRLFEAGRDGDVAELFDIQRRAIEVGEGLFSGVRGQHIDGAYDKILTNIVDPKFSRRLLPPYESVPEEVAARAKAYYEQHCRDLS